MSVLHVTVAEPLTASLARAGSTMQALQRGEAAATYEGIGFEDMAQMLAVFTPQRWSLIATLRATGPLSVAELARRLGRDYKNVHTDVAALAEWRAVERAADGRVSVPWSEIIVDLKLPQEVAA
jgi:predicted transcriptional regulator